MFTTGGIVGLAEGIINDTCFVPHYFHIRPSVPTFQKLSKAMQKKQILSTSGTMNWSSGLLMTFVNLIIHTFFFVRVSLRRSRNHPMWTHDRMIRHLLLSVLWKKNCNPGPRVNGRRTQPAVVWLVEKSVSLLFGEKTGKLSLLPWFT